MLCSAFHQLRFGLAVEEVNGTMSDMSHDSGNMIYTIHEPISTMILDRNTGRTAD